MDRVWNTWNDREIGLRDKYGPFTPDLNFLSLDSSTAPSSPSKGFPIRDPWRSISSVERVHYSPAFFIRRVTKELDGRRDGYPGVERRVLSESLDCPSPSFLNSKLSRGKILRIISSILPFFLAYFSPNKGKRNGTTLIALNRRITIFPIPLSLNLITESREFDEIARNTRPANNGIK